MIVEPAIDEHAAKLIGKTPMKCIQDAKSNAMLHPAAELLNGIKGNRDGLFMEETY
jgi:hypothetical protein